MDVPWRNSRHFDWVDSCLLAVLSSLATHQHGGILLLGWSLPNTRRSLNSRLWLKLGSSLEIRVGREFRGGTGVPRVVAAFKESLILVFRMKDLSHPSEAGGSGCLLAPSCRSRLRSYTSLCLPAPLPCETRRHLVSSWKPALLYGWTDIMHEGSTPTTNPTTPVLLSGR